MKLRLFNLAAMLLLCVGMQAQTSLIATLTHGGDFTVYYGENALKEAYAAAQDGDGITLSSGTFQAVDTIRKAISLRGAGMMTHGQTGPTIIDGPITFRGQHHPKQMSVEGCYFTELVRFYGEGLSDEVTLSKCKFGYLTVADFVFVKYINCWGSVDLGNHYSAGTTQAYCTNCIIPSIQGVQIDRLVTIDHCVVLGSNLSERLVARNSVICDSYGNLSGKITCSNCVGVSNEQGHDLFENIADGDNQMVYGYENIFKTYRGGSTDGETFELTDEAAAKYLGDDDTQVGIYGSSAPFDPLPSTAIVKKFSVKASETENGNIGVTINVE